MKQKHKKKPPVSFSWSKNWGWYCPILPMVLVNGVEGIGWDLPLCHSVFFMDSDAKKSSLRRSSLTLHGSKEHFFPGNMMKAMEFHPQAGKPRKIQGFPADLLKIAPFFLPRNWLEQLCAQLQPQGTVQKHWGVDFKVIREYDIYTQYIFFMKRSYYKYVFFFTS